MAKNDSGYFGLQLGEAIGTGAGHIANALQRKYALEQDRINREMERAEMQKRQEQMFQQQQGLMLAKEGYEMSPAGFEKFIADRQKNRVMTTRAQALEQQKLEADIARPQRGMTPPPGYRFLPTGELEAIPGGPAAADISTKEDAKIKPMKSVSGTIEELRGLYSDLDKLGGIVNVEKPSLYNIGPRIGSSSVGQFLGKTIGSKEQSIRNQIEMARPLLINYIRQATQMGAKGMDSEKELEFYLSAATDPKRDIQANMAALDRLDKAYGLSSIMGAGPAKVVPQAEEIQIRTLKDGTKVRVRRASDGSWEEVE